MDRYKDIIPDYQSFRKCSEREGPIKTVRENTLKSGEDFEARLRENFGEVLRSDWNPKVYRLPETRKPGKTEMHWRGEYYVQEESATAPVNCLGLETGERVLDLCSAPGGKTVQIASKTGNNADLVSVDSSKSRLSTLQSNVFRTGSVCAKTVHADGRKLDMKGFDKIIVDAPCTGEGDRYYRNYKPASLDESRSLSELQQSLCEKAAKMLKPGGRMVYSTCTISPTENEVVVEKVSENTSLSLIDPGVEVPGYEGVSSFRENVFDIDTSKLVRIYPHNLNSGVIFFAVFEKGC